MLDKNDFFWKAFDLLNNGRYVQARELFEHLETDDAKIQLAYMYRLGLGGEPRLEASIQLYRDLVEKGNVIVTYDLASLLLSLNRSEEALFFLLSRQSKVIVLQLTGQRKYVMVIKVPIQTPAYICTTLTRPQNKVIYLHNEIFLKKSICNPDLL